MIDVTLDLGLLVWFLRSKALKMVDTKIHTYMIVLHRFRCRRVWIQLVPRLLSFLDQVLWSLLQNISWNRLLAVHTTVYL